MGVPRRGTASGTAQGTSEVRIRSAFATELQVKLILHIWRQKNPADNGRMVRYEAANVNADMSFLEMLDVLNEELTLRGEDPVAFDSDCREVICGTCGLLISAGAHGPPPGTTVCQLHLQHFKDQ